MQRLDPFEVFDGVVVSYVSSQGASSAYVALPID